MIEEWRDIAGYAGKYQVSNLGRVRSTAWRNTKTVRVMYLKPHNQGYKQIELTDGTTRKMYMVHRLVAQAFVPNPNNYDYVNHLDENRTNNRTDNLEWCTQSENTKYSYKPHKTSVVRRTKAIMQMTDDGTVLKIWNNAVQIKHEKGWSDWSISECCRGHRKQAYGYVWQYAT